MENTEVIEIEFNIEDQGSRLDAALTNRVEEFSRNYIQKLILQQNVMINGTAAKDKNYRVSSGDICKIIVEPPETISAEPEDIPLNIVFEDQDLIIINKPKGIVVHPAPGNYTGTVVNALMYHSDSLSSINGTIRPGIVHRIDKDTSGLLIIAKNDTAHRSLAEQLKNHTIKREYRAIVYNSFKEESGTVDEPVGRDLHNRLRMAVDRRSGKRAVTHFSVVERLGAFCHISCRLETGRTHQIRVHMSYINHPLVGDYVYGPSRKFPGADSQMLHAKTLGFVHPKTGEYMEFDSTLPDYFCDILHKLNAEIYY